MAKNTLVGAYSEIVAAQEVSERMTGLDSSHLQMQESSGSMMRHSMRLCCYPPGSETLSLREVAPIFWDGAEDYPIRIPWIFQPHSTCIHTTKEIIRLMNEMDISPFNMKDIRLHKSICASKVKQPTRNYYEVLQLQKRYCWLLSYLKLYVV